MNFLCLCSLKKNQQKKRKDGVKNKILEIKLKHCHEEQMILPIDTFYKQGVLTYLLWKVLPDRDSIICLEVAYSRGLGKA